MYTIIMSNEILVVVKYTLNLGRCPVVSLLAILGCVVYVDHLIGMTTDCSTDYLG